MGLSLKRLFSFKKMPDGPLFALIKPKKVEYFGLVVKI